MISGFVWMLKKLTQSHKKSKNLNSFRSETPEKRANNIREPASKQRFERWWQENRNTLCKITWFRNLSTFIVFPRQFIVTGRTEISSSKWKHTKIATIVHLNPSLYSCDPNNPLTFLGYKFAVSGLIWSDQWGTKLWRICCRIFSRIFSRILDPSYSYSKVICFILYQSL